MVRENQPSRANLDPIEMKPYMPPTDRKRSSPPPIVEAAESPDASGVVDNPEPPERGDGGSGDQPSVFLDKESLMGREYKAGDTIEMKVLAVDPETGEVEASCAPKSSKPTEEAPSVAMMDEEFED